VEPGRLEAACSMQRVQMRSLGTFSYCALPTLSEVNQISWEQILKYPSTPKNSREEVSVHGDSSNYRQESGAGTPLL